jgi:hypothetical protein
MSGHELNAEKQRVRSIGSGLGVALGRNVGPKRLVEI